MRHTLGENVSAERFFDNLARTLAEPMPRRRAIRVLATSAVAVAMPGIGPRAAGAATKQYQCNPNVETCCGRNERVCLKDAPTPINKGYCCGPSQFMWCGDKRNGYKCVNVCPDARRCGQICCPPDTTCTPRGCVLTSCGGARCQSGQRCCPGTQLMPRARCYDPDTQCCTPVKGVVPKRPITELEWCPDRKAKPNHTPGANGCGPVGGVLTPFVPNRFFRADFKPGCDFHDMCYETCRKNKAFCDNRFHTLLAAECRSNYGLGLRRQACLTQARRYYLAVSHGGANAYEAAQRKACDCC